MSLQKTIAKAKSLKSKMEKAQTARLIQAVEAMLSLEQSDELSHYQNDLAALGL